MIKVNVNGIRVNKNNSWQNKRHSLTTFATLNHLFENGSVSDLWHTVRRIMKNWIKLKKGIINIIEMIIAIESMNCGGKTTICNKLCDILNKMGICSIVIKAPDYDGLCGNDIS